ncbi:MAG TPA: hypothetical protein VKT82_01945 [Ktedonobacterales bacterium]|nr:hypothetical protein [Ktedonobacterales bacterium]
MALLTGSPRPPSFPSDRYLHTNPLRREAGLRLLTEHLPEPLRWDIIRAWRRPSLFHGMEPPLALQYAQRQQFDEETLALVWPRTIAWFMLTELEIARRLVEAPLASISRVTRDSLLRTQGVYLRRLYAALAAQIGETTARAEFKRLLSSVG